MFTNTVNLADGVTVIPTAITDGPSNRKTLRGSADGKIQMSIAHQESNENPGFVTQRSTVRIAQVINLAGSDKTVNGYVQFTCSFPKDHMTPQDVAQLATALVNFLWDGENPSSLAHLDDAQILATITRLFAGEP